MSFKVQIENIVVKCQRCQNMIPGTYWINMYNANESFSSTQKHKATCGKICELFVKGAHESMESCQLCKNGAPHR